MDNKKKKLKWPLRVLPHINMSVLLCGEQSSDWF